MPLHPIIALDHILDEYRDHLLTEFRARDNDLLKALEEEVGRDLFLAQEPFYQEQLQGFEVDRPALPFLPCASSGLSALKNLVEPAKARGPDYKLKLKSAGMR
jgi:hypothetical protein